VVTPRRQGPGRPRVHLGRGVACLGQLGHRRGGRVLGAVALVVVVRAWVGVWPAALVGATAVTVGLLAGWAALDRRLFTARAHRARPVLVGGPPGARPLDGQAGHVVFARGLAGLAGWYLAECERQEAER
jgi:hypothetical protein